MELFGLPGKKNERELVLSAGIKYAESMRNIEAINWGVTRFWLKGIRNFDVLDRETGLLSATYVNPGTHVVYEEALSAVQQEIGRLNRLDLRPVATMLGHDLDRLRKAAVTNLFMSYYPPRLGYENAKKWHDTLLVHYGTVGIGIAEHPIPKGATRPWQPYYRVYAPWEMLGLPADAPISSGVKCVGIEEWMPYKRLESIVANQKKYNPQSMIPKLTLPESKEKLERQPMYAATPLWGQVDIRLGSQAPLLGPGVGNNADQMSWTVDKVQGEDFIKVVWLHFTHDGEHLDATVCMSGEVELGLRDYWSDGEDLPFPIGISRYADVGGFYGKGYAEPKISMNQITERLLENLIRNVCDTDSFGLLFIPRSAGIKDFNLKRPKEGGPRYIYYQTDPMAPENRPYAIDPHTNGNFPAQVLQTVTALEQKVLPQYSIFSDQAPQRADSGQALTTVREAANETRAPVDSAIVTSWNTCHKSLLDMGRRILGSSAFGLPLVSLDTAIVGVTIDPQSGMVKLDKNKLPRYDEVGITVKSFSPEDPNAIAAHLWQCLERQILTPRQFRILWRLKAIAEHPVGNDEEWEAYQMANLNVIMAFGDGEIPSQVLDPMGGPRDVHLAVYTAFTAGPRFALASTSVRSQFKKLIGKYREGMGWPNEMPDSAMQPEEAAMMQMQLEQGGGGGAPPNLQQMMSMLGGVSG